MPGKLEHFSFYTSEILFGFTDVLVIFVLFLFAAMSFCPSPLYAFKILHCEASSPFKSM